ncbi:hypothetical protein POM88_038451 [Heracleum sosnowskyi]|uniref:Serine protease n=1 Tax=Heracleum sosnowskyi TaxID=360622 RepID=A0AAD8HB87_9APIA|nr:hypothetical protein POM88_038451 [Heracleum sosnowskyi]
MDAFDNSEQIRHTQLSDNSEHIRHTQLSENLKPIIWVIKVSGVVKRHPQKFFATGFSMRNDGLLLTSAHAINGVTAMKIKARKLTEEKFETAEVKYIRLKWDLALLKVNNVTDCSVGEFVSDGSIWKGQPLLHIGHPFDFVGSYLIGRACFSCVENVISPRNSENCGSYDSKACKQTPEYRVMGHMWNRAYFSRNQDLSFSFEKSLVPSVPIVQCNGINARPGSSGGPLFNMEGKVAGMLVGKVDGFDIAIHVAALKMFFTDATTPSGPDATAPSGPEEPSKKQRIC